MNVPAVKGRGPGRGRAVGNLALALAFLVSGGGTGPWSPPWEHAPFVISELLRRRDAARCISVRCPLSVHLVNVRALVSAREQTPDPGRFCPPRPPRRHVCCWCCRGHLRGKEEKREKAWPGAISSPPKNPWLHIVVPTAINEAGAEHAVDVQTGRVGSRVYCSTRFAAGHSPEPTRPLQGTDQRGAVYSVAGRRSRKPLAAQHGLGWNEEGFVL